MPAWWPDGVELHYLERGKGPAVILLHGGMGDCHSWSAQMEALSGLYRPIAYSRRRYSPNRNAATALSIDAEVADLARLATRLRIDRAHLVGTSYGALIALAFALEHPRRVRSLVLAEPPLHRWARDTPAGAALHAAFMVDVWQPARDAFRSGQARRALQILVDGMTGREAFGSLPAVRLDAALRNAAAMQTLTEAADPFPDLPRAAVDRLAIPALLVEGEHTSPLHRAVMDRLAHAMPDAARAVIPGAGHGSPHQNPQAFTQATLRFLLRHDAAANAG